jgi:xanthine dehydrogenase accessory factor
MVEEFYSKQESLTKQNEFFVEATVVWREIPTSGKSGDRAIIDKHGEITGWVGGGCVKGIVLKEAEDAMRTGRPRLVKIGKTLSDVKQEGVAEYKMTCMSEGAVEVFLKPALPQSHIVVIGQTLIAKALVQLAKVSGYRVSAVAPGAGPSTFEKVDDLITQMSLQQVKITPVSAIVACTQGENDEQALELMLSQPCLYKGFVASRKKREMLFDSLADQGMNKEQLDSIHSPAGLDINAKKPLEVAVSILAEIIQVRNNSQATGFTQFTSSSLEAQGGKFFINPVCGVPVDTNNPKHIVMYNDEKVYFCCDGCKVQFEADPEKYMKNPVSKEV